MLQCLFIHSFGGVIDEVGVIEEVGVIDEVGVIAVNPKGAGLPSPENGDKRGWRH